MPFNFLSIQVIHLIKEKSFHERVSINRSAVPAKPWEHPLAHGQHIDYRNTLNGRQPSAHDNTFFNGGISQESDQKHEYESHPPSVLWATRDPARAGGSHAPHPGGLGYSGHQPSQASYVPQFSSGNGAADYYFPSEQSAAHYQQPDSTGFSPHVIPASACSPAPLESRACAPPQPAAAAALAAMPPLIRHSIS